MAQRVEARNAFVRASSGASLEVEIAYPAALASRAKFQACMPFCMQVCRLSFCMALAHSPISGRNNQIGSAH
jgi:hypothetical protein